MCILEMMFASLSDRPMLVKQVGNRRMHTSLMLEFGEKETMECLSTGRSYHVLPQHVQANYEQNQVPRTYHIAVLVSVLRCSIGHGSARATKGCRPEGRERPADFRPKFPVTVMHFLSPCLLCPVGPGLGTGTIMLLLATFMFAYTHA